MSIEEVRKQIAQRRQNIRQAQSQVQAQRQVLSQRQLRGTTREQRLKTIEKFKQAKEEKLKEIKGVEEKFEAEARPIEKQITDYEKAVAAQQAEQSQWEAARKLVAKKGGMAIYYAKGSDISSKVKALVEGGNLEGTTTGQVSVADIKARIEAMKTPKGIVSESIYEDLQERAKEGDKIARETLGKIGATIDPNPRGNIVSESLYNDIVKRAGAGDKIAQENLNNLGGYIPQSYIDEQQKIYEREKTFVNRFKDRGVIAIGEEISKIGERVGKNPAVQGAVQSLIGTAMFATGDTSAFNKNTGSAFSAGTSGAIKTATGITARGGVYFIPGVGGLLLVGEGVSSYATTGGRRQIEETSSWLSSKRVPTKISSSVAWGLPAVEIGLGGFALYSDIKSIRGGIQMVGQQKETILQRITKQIREKQATKLVQEQKIAAQYGLSYTKNYGLIGKPTGASSLSKLFKRISKEIGYSREYGLIGKPTPSQFEGLLLRTKKFATSSKYGMLQPTKVKTIKSKSLLNWGVLGREVSPSKARLQTVIKEIGYSRKYGLLGQSTRVKTIKSKELLNWGVLGREVSPSKVRFQNAVKTAGYTKDYGLLGYPNKVKVTKSKELLNWGVLGREPDWTIKGLLKQKISPLKGRVLKFIEPYKLNVIKRLNQVDDFFYNRAIQRTRIYKKYGEYGIIGKSPTKIKMDVLSTNFGYTKKYGLLGQPTPTYGEGGILRYKGLLGKAKPIKRIEETITTIGSPSNVQPLTDIQMMALQRFRESTIGADIIPISSPRSEIIIKSSTSPQQSLLMKPNMITSNVVASIEVPEVSSSSLGNIGGSIFAGKGVIEKSQGMGISIIRDMGMDIENVGLNLRSSSSLLLKSLPKLEVKDISASITGIKLKDVITPSLDQKQNVRQKQKGQEKQTQSLESIIKIKPKQKTPLLLKDSLLQRLAKKVDEGGFEVLGKRFGKEFSLLKTKSQKEAEFGLKKFLKGTLGRSGKILKGGKALGFEELKSFGFEYRPAKKDKTRVVQKSKFSLGTKAETSEIMFFKRKASKKSKKKKSKFWFD